MTNEVINILFESKEQFLETENLKTVRNKDVVTKYFTKMDYIPCICTVITMELLSALQTINFVYIEDNFLYYRGF